MMSGKSSSDEATNAETQNINDIKDDKSMMQESQESR